MVCRRMPVLRETVGSYCMLSRDDLAAAQLHVLWGHCKYKVYVSTRSAARGTATPCAGGVQEGEPSLSGPTGMKIRTTASEYPCIHANNPHTRFVLRRVWYASQNPSVHETHQHNGRSRTRVRYTIMVVQDIMTSQEIVSSEVRCCRVAIMSRYGSLLHFTAGIKT